MRNARCRAAMAFLLIPFSANAQAPNPAQRMPEQFWAYKPAFLPPYRAPNKPHWRLSEILAAHRGQSDWVQPLVRNQDQEADYISLAPGKKTKPRFYANDRFVFIVQDGAIKVTIDGGEAFTATKGFMVNVPARHVYSLETTSPMPSLRFEVRTARTHALYPLSETPDPVAGGSYVKVTGTPGPAKDPDRNPLYLDFQRGVAEGKLPTIFVRDDHFTANVIRAKGVPVPPDSDRGHFHVDINEFWFIMEGKLGYKIEGLPYFEADQGDVVTAVSGRWHRALSSPNAPISTRIPINPRPPILHNFEPAD